MLPPELWGIHGTELQYLPGRGLTDRTVTGSTLVTKQWVTEGWCVSLDSGLIYVPSKDAIMLS